MRDFIKVMKPCEAKDKLSWLLNDLQNLDNKYLKEVAKRLIQVIKDVHVLDSYRYKLIYLGKSISKETLEDSKKNVRIFKQKLY